MAGVKLKRLKIDRYRNVAPGTELVFNDTFNVLLGQNGTGKTTLLRLISMVVAHKFAPLKDKEFAFEYELAYPGLNVRVNIANRQQMIAPGRVPEGLLRADIPHLRGESMTWAYTVTVQADGNEKSYTISGKPNAVVLNVESKPDADQHFLDIASPFEGISFIDQIFILLACLGAIDEKTRKQVSKFLEVDQRDICLNAGRFDEALGGFHTMSGLNGSLDDRLGKSAFTIVRYKGSSFHHEPILFWPRRLWAHLSCLPAEELTSESIKIAHPELDFLKKAIELFGFEAGEMILRLSEKDVQDGHERLTYSNFSFLFTLDQGSMITQEALSYGQKRLLSFLYYVAANDDIIIADELVNGMHHAWIEACLDAIDDRQSFLTSQNPLLLDFLPFTSAEEVQHSFIQCGREKREDQRTQLIWANMTAENADSFYRAYETGVQHVSEILRTKGLW